MSSSPLFVRAAAALALFSASAGAPAVLAPAAAQTSKPAEMRKLEPSATRVALVPVVDLTGEKEDQRRDQANAVRSEVTSQFTQRGFQIVDEAAVNKAVADLKLDFNDEENQRREPLYKVGNALDADLVIFVVITQTYSKVKQNLFSTEREGLAKTKTWLLDVREEKPVLSAYVWEGKSSGSAGLFTKGNRSRMGAAAGNSIRDVLNDVLKAYPRKK